MEWDGFMLACEWREHDDDGGNEDHDDDDDNDTNNITYWGRKQKEKHYI